MARGRKIHTVESLLARTVEDGDCNIWTGYSTSKTPQVDVNGKMTSVRKVLYELSGRQAQGLHFGTSCGTLNCVCPDHIVARNRTSHMRHMAKVSAKGPGNAARKAAITRIKRAAGKLDMEKARRIREMEGTYRQIASEFDISHSLVGKIKRGSYWRELSNPFAGLMG
jgi:hypothetical protein